MSGAAFLRLKKLKGGGIIAVAARHNKRVIQGQVGAAGSIDPIRSHLNESLRGPQTDDDVAQLAKDHLKAAGVVNLRRDAVNALEVVFSLPVGSQIDDVAYFTACVDWIEGQFNAPVLSADIHRDEAAKHCHVLILPLVNGRMTGSDLVGNRQKLQALQQQFFDAVASRYGLRKAPARLQGATRQDAATEVLKRLKSTSDPVLRSTAWPLIRDGIEGNPAPWLLALSIDFEPPKKKLKTMAQIFTGKGKGAAREAKPIGFTMPESTKPIGFGTPGKRQTLCSVGFAPKTPSPTPAKRSLHPNDYDGTPPAPPARKDEAVGAIGDSVTPDQPFTKIVRIRDSDLDASQFDPATGEYFAPPPAPVRLQKKPLTAMEDEIQTPRYCN